jgi:hypothetical protein
MQGLPYSLRETEIKTFVGFEALYIFLLFPCILQLSQQMTKE